jgi:hypothetical protein
MQVSDDSSGATRAHHTRRRREISRRRRETSGTECCKTSGSCAKHSAVPTSSCHLMCWPGAERRHSAAKHQNSRVRRVFDSSGAPDAILQQRASRIGPLNRSGPFGDQAMARLLVRLGSHTVPRTDLLHDLLVTQDRVVKIHQNGSILLAQNGRAIQT